ncbi:MAG: glycoside hydrolase family 15 protein [Hyphomicrobiales bacterium]|nr:glycoside hydrolase family 15 protein [Hyphomicrobiales bacterium]
MADLNLGVIGNSSLGALVDRKGRICWSCFPRFDGDPVFNSLVNGGPDGEDPAAGFFDFALQDFARSEQHYLGNTAILITTLFDSDGNALEIADFAPRFRSRGRVFRPMQIVRQVRPVIGHPRITIRLRPTFDYGATRPQVTRGSNHIRFVGNELALRCTTDAPISFIASEVPFVLEEPFCMLFGVDESLAEGVVETARNFFDHTREYWTEWARFLAIPYEWQEAVIRAAITLKLHAFEESGGIIAAMTTSIPEAANTERNWDYRFCWLRDAYFVVQALNRLGATLTMEDHLRYITNIAAATADDDHLQPVYGITMEEKLVEQQVPHLRGYRAMGPVRRGNQAYEHIQNDVPGSVILAATQAFFDARIDRPGDAKLFERLEDVGRRCIRIYDKPDAGLWELRTMARVHTYSAAMCWAGTDRLAKIARRLGMTTREAYWRKHADTIRDRILAEAWDPAQNTFVESFGGSEVDASLLLLFEIGFIDASDPRFVGTVDAIGAKLKRGEHLFRYAIADDFGRPENAFTICTFWYIDALASIGRTDEARRMFENLLTCRNHLGLLSEDLDTETGELWGNFPQTYSMVGLINAAMRLSIRWRDAF